MLATTPCTVKYLAGSNTQLHIWNTDSDTMKSMYEKV